jgi:hypothetical protein
VPVEGARRELARRKHRRECPRAGRNRLEGQVVEEVVIHAPTVAGGDDAAVMVLLRIGDASRSDP